MGRMIRDLIRHDAADPDFVRRVQAAYVTAAEAEQALTFSCTDEKVEIEHSAGE